MRFFFVLFSLFLASKTGFLYPVQAQETDTSCSVDSNLCWPRIKPGVGGSSVEAFQKLLNLKGTRLKVTGRFDASTTKAVKSYQRKHKLVVDGVVGFQTWESVVPTLRRGNKGQAVRVLQQLLWSRNHGTTRDGIFGAATERQVKAFESELLVFDTQKITGIADEHVWCFLVHGTYYLS